MSTKQLNSAEINDTAVAAADPASEEGAIETIAVPNGGNDEESAAASTGTDSTISSSSNAAEDAGQQRTTNRFVKRGGSLVMAAAALAVIGATSVHLAGRPTTDFSSSKQVAVSSGDIVIKGFTKVGDGNCRDEGDNTYDYVEYTPVADAKKCAKQCSKCPGGGQKGTNNVELVFRGFGFAYSERCRCLVEDGATFTQSVCKGADIAETGNKGSGEIKSVVLGKGSPECWKINSKSSKSPKSGSKGGKSS